MLLVRKNVGMIRVRQTSSHFPRPDCILWRSFYLNSNRI